MTLPTRAATEYSTETIHTLEFVNGYQRFGISISPSAQYVAVICSIREGIKGDIIIYVKDQETSQYKFFMCHKNIRCQSHLYFDRIQFSANESEVLLPESSLGSFSVFNFSTGNKIRGIRCLNLQVNTGFCYPRYVFAWSSRRKEILCCVGTHTIHVYNELGGDPIKTIRLSHGIAAVKTDHNGEFLGYNIGEKLWYRICIDTGSLLKLLPDGYTSTGNPDDILFLRDEQDKQVLININPCEEGGSRPLPTIEVFDIQNE